MRDFHPSLTSTDNTPTSACFRASTINSTGKRFLHNESPFISDWIRRKLSLNMHQKRGCPSLLNVTVLFIKEGMKEEFIWKGDKNLLRMAKYLATSKPEEKTRAK